jgi:hypothetical protein
MRGAGAAGSVVRHSLPPVSIKAGIYGGFLGLMLFIQAACAIGRRFLRPDR